MTGTFLILFLQGLDDEVAIRTRADQLVQFSRGTLRAFHVSVCKCAKAVHGEDSLLTGALRLERTLHAAPVDVASGAAACKWKSEGSLSGWGEAATCEDLRDLDRAGGASSAADSSDVSTASGRKGPCKRK